MLQTENRALLTVRFHLQGTRPIVRLLHCAYASLIDPRYALTGSQTYLLLTSKIEHSEIEPEPVNAMRNELAV